MKLAGMTVVAARRILLRTLAQSQIPMCQQCCHYRGPPPLQHSVASRLDRVKKPFIPDESSPYIQEWQKFPEVMDEYKRKAWAKFGSASGVDLKEILPTKEEIEEEWEAEKRWWPTFHELKDAAQNEKRAKEEEQAAYEKKVAENLAKMPKWIEQWKVEQEKVKEKELEGLRRREDMIERALEEVNYKIHPGSKRFKDFLKVFAEKERLAKKKAKKLARQMKKQ